LDRTHLSQRFLIDVQLRQLEGILNQLTAWVTFFGPQNFHDVESKRDIGIIEQPQPGEATFRNAQLFLSIYCFNRPAEFFAAARFYLHKHQRVAVSANNVDLTAVAVFEIAKLR